jgi:vitamin B12 transporter
VSGLRSGTFLLALLFPAQVALADARALDGGIEPLDASVWAPQELADASSREPASATLGVEPAATAVEVTVRGARSVAQQRVKSSEAVTVVDLRDAKKRSADLGEVLARVAGVSIRRFGGLGSEFRFSLNGLYDAQVRFFVDGVPIDRVYVAGIANTPVNMVQNVEIYRGVVPLRLGADALGGAVNLVSSARYETGLQASYQVGSFNTHRTTLSGRYRHEPSGVIAGADLFVDYADNDYHVDVQVSDPLGRPTSARVRRFHDRYWAYGAALEAGVVDKPYARRLLARLFTSQYEKEIQNNVRMTVPYGEPYYGEAIRGGLVTYQNALARNLELDVVGSYTHRAIDFVDQGRWRYDWFGKRGMQPLRRPGELAGQARDQTIWQQGAFGRVVLNAKLAEQHTLTATLSPDYVTRTGEQRLLPDPMARDPLSADRRAFKLVSGIGYTLHAAPLSSAPQARARRPEHYRIENTLFGKSYVYRVKSEQPLSGGISRRHDQQRNEVGAGDTLRVMLLGEVLLAKASYEFATRLPDTDEIFGNGVLVVENLSLKPERGHNANLGLQLDVRRTKAGTFWADINGFFRDTRDQIVLFGRDVDYRYENIYRARSLGIENSVKWSSPGQYLTLDGQVTYMDQRNVSSRGTFGAFQGDRIPNRPWLFASWGGYLQFRGVLHDSDRIEPFYQGRFVDTFYFGWESVGQRESKPTIPAQTSHTVGLTYAIELGATTLHGTFDIQNVTDARLYDAFGVQRPGRGYYLKLVAEL